jgi:hypothetical protein
MWFPYFALPYYVVRIAEMRPVLIVLAALTTIGILVWKKPRCWTLWIAGIVAGELILIFLGTAGRDRR